MIVALKNHVSQTDGSTDDISAIQLLGRVLIDNKIGKKKKMIGDNRTYHYFGLKSRLLDKQQKQETQDKLRKEEMTANAKLINEALESDSVGNFE